MPKPLLCVTVTAATTAELREKRDAVPDADLIELRLDSVADPSVAGALAGRRRPVIVTCRPVHEGGRFNGSEEARRRILADAISLGAEYVDLEWQAHFDDLITQTGGSRIVLSMHDFEGVPDDLSDRVHAMRATGAEVVKVAVTTRCLSDCVGLLGLAGQAASRPGLVVIGMGDAGLITRVLAGRFGSTWTYAGGLRNVGQVSSATLLEDYHLRALTEKTHIYGLVGGTVAHSVSPAMHNAAFRATRLDAVYLPFPAVSARDFVTFGRAIGIKGASVTIPHKVSIADSLDEVYPVARRIGAVNTIRSENGRWIGDNTDAAGFLEPLTHRVALAGLRTAVLGAGGAARAVTVALASSGASVCVHARNVQQAADVAMLAPATVGPWPPARDSWDLLINCTPIGMHPRVDETPVPADHLTGRYVYDLIYNPTTTRLLREAGERGCETIGGLDMLVAQALEQFQWWTGIRPPAGVMRDAALKRLAEFGHHEDHHI